MNEGCFYRAGHCPALSHAHRLLEQWGYSFSPKPCQEVRYLLLPVTSFDEKGQIKGGGKLDEILQKLPKDITVIGGNLHSPLLEGYQTIDLLQDPDYVTENAQITAHCALALAMNALPVVPARQKALVIGWGRIGKCLAQLLKGMGAQVTVAARKAADRAMLRALGYNAIDTADLDTTPYRLIFNTVPAMVCPECPGKGLKIDLASRQGLGGGDVIWARGLPGKHAPQSAGQLMAQSIARIINKE